MTAKAKSAITQLAEDIDADAKDGSTVSIGGHVAGTDEGSESFQQELSQRRAESVRDALEEAVEGDVRFDATGYGAERPIAENDNEKNRRLNRWVVVTYQR